MAFPADAATPGAPVSDLAALARRRARLGALLGRLLVEEPGPDVAPLVAGIPALAPLAEANAARSAEYERLLLREVPVFESVFLGADGRRGGEVAAAIAGTYSRHGFDEQWRVAGPDHLGLELRCYAFLCAEEADGWEREQPDRAARAVDGERDLLAAHLGRWGEVAAEAVARRAAGSPYGVVAEAVGDFLAEECERLRPAPDHPGLAPLDIECAPAAPSPAQLAGWLLAPARSGCFLDAEDVAAAARPLGVPWRPSDGRGRLHQVIDAAVDTAELRTLLDGLRPAVERWHAWHAARAEMRSGDRRTWMAWQLRAEQTLALLDEVAAREPSDRGAGPLVVTAHAPTRAEAYAAARDALAALSAAGVTSSVAVDLEPTLAAELAALLDAGALEVRLGIRSDGGEIGAVAGAVAGARPDVVLCPEVGPGAAELRVESGRTDALVERVRRVLGSGRRGHD
jgi:TorA maturation chaperone TorD